MTKAYVAFGSNVGKRKFYIENALRALSVSAGIKCLRVSPLYETEPVGGPEQNAFLNGVVEIETRLSPMELLKTLRRQEVEAGRVRHTRWGPRTLDLDLLIFGKTKSRSKSLTIPHPRYHMRRFVLAPFVKLAPKLIHPIIRKRNETLLRELTVPDQRVTMLGPWKKFRFHSSKKRRKKKFRS